MCVIIHRLVNSKKIATSDLEQIIKKNPHGWGLSYINKNGKLIVEKSVDMKLAYNAFRQVERQNIEFLFHVRWATEGEKTTENCHPYNIHGGVLFHNGTMKKLALWNKIKSDSWHFGVRFSKAFKRGISLNEIIHKYKDVIDGGRLAFMFENGNIKRVGEWEEIDGNFFSNVRWKYGGYYYYYDNNDDYYEKLYGDKTSQSNKTIDRYNSSRWLNIHSKRKNQKKSHDKFLDKFDNYDFQKSSGIETLSCSDLYAILVSDIKQGIELLKKRISHEVSKCV